MNASGIRSLWIRQRDYASWPNPPNNGHSNCDKRSSGAACGAIQLSGLFCEMAQDRVHVQSVFETGRAGLCEPRLLMCIQRS
jgi:hypothetical protein